MSNRPNNQQRPGQHGAHHSQEGRSSLPESGSPSYESKRFVSRPRFNSTHDSSPPRAEPRGGVPYAHSEHSGHYRPNAYPRDRPNPQWERSPQPPGRSASPGYGGSNAGVYERYEAPRRERPGESPAERAAEHTGDHLGERAQGRHGGGGAEGQRYYDRRENAARTHPRHASRYDGRTQQQQRYEGQQQRYEEQQQQHHQPKQRYEGQQQQQQHHHQNQRYEGQQHQQNHRYEGEQQQRYEGQQHRGGHRDYREYNDFRNYQYDEGRWARSHPPNGAQYTPYENSTQQELEKQDRFERRQRHDEFHHQRSEARFQRDLRRPDRLEQMKEELLVPRRYEPGRLDDRRSGDGRSGAPKRGGHGKYNYGSAAEDVEEEKELIKVMQRTKEVSFEEKGEAGGRPEEEAGKSGKERRERDGQRRNGSDRGKRKQETLIRLGEGGSGKTEAVMDGATGEVKQVEKRKFRNMGEFLGKAEVEEPEEEQLIQFC